MKRQKTKPSFSFVEKINAFFDSKLNTVFLVSIILSILIFYNLFDIRVSLSGDDSEYILRAYNFIHGEFPTFQGPLYPIVLSPFIALFGISLPLLKMLSALFLLASFYFFYKSLKGRISPITLIFIIFTIAINSFIAFYSTHTFSEALFMFIQSLLFYLFFSYIIDEQKIRVTHFIFLGLLAFMLYMTRTIGIAGIISASLFFIVTKSWKKLIAGIVSFSFFYLLTDVLKKTFWEMDGSQFSSQLKILLQKHPYQPAQGNDDIAGFIQRFWDNSNLYLSEHLFRFIGFKNFTSTEINPVLTILVYILLAIALFYSFRKNRHILFLTLYGIVFLGTTFLMIQKFWNQDRLIIPVFPIILTSVFFGIFQLFTLQKFRKFQFIPILLSIIILFTSLKTTMQRIEVNKPVLKNSLEGNMVYGFTPDWQNYLLLSKYAGENIPKDELIACRKPGMSFIYGNHNFYGISSIPSVNIDDTFVEDKKYYSVPAGNALLRRLPASMLKSVVLSKTDTLENHRAFFLFEADSALMLNNIDNYTVTKETIRTSSSELNIYSPDQLLDILEKNNVKYVIIAHLRLIPNKKTDRTINTVSRYMNYISVKYPSILSKVYEVGKDEKATLYKINYNIRN
jgi:hypothetical protein